jgi:Tol biopolymer transport system component
MNRIRALSATVVALLATAMLLALPSPSGAIASGANGRILFVSDRDGDKEIFAVRSDGTGLIQLTNNTSNDYDPAVSADGTKVAFVTDRDGKVELYTMNIDGSSQTRITNNAYTESHPSWNPLGGQLVWASLNGADSDIWKGNSNGTGAGDLTPDPVAFDANPSWSPGGINLAFDSTNRAGNTGTDIYTMKNDGTVITRLTTTGKDSNPSYAPDNKNLTFESARGSATEGPVLFATMSKKLIGVAVTSTRVLVTQFNSDIVRQIDSNGNTTNFATLPTTGSSIERYIAISPGNGGFPKDYVYVTVGPNIYEITPDGLTVTLCENIPSLPNGETGVTFDTVGTFQNRMILTDRRGPVYALDACGGTVSSLGDVGAQIEGPLVAPLSFGVFGGQILMGNEFQDKVFALSNNGVVSTVTTTESPEGLIQIPATVCNMGTSGGAYFIAMKDAKQVWKMDASNFTGLSDDIMAPAELTTELNRLHWDGATVVVSQVWPAFSTPDLEGSAFAPCGTGSPKQSSQTQASGPREIYKMTTTGTLQTPLTSNSTDDINPAWSPDGLSIVFQADRDDPGQPGCEGTLSCKYEVYKMNSVDGSGQTNISSNTTANDATPDWEAVTGVVSVRNNFFDPATTKPKLGVGLLFDVTGNNGHTITDNSGMGLFGSAVLSANQFYVLRLWGAGSYPYYCTVHPTEMTGTLNVPMSAAPKTGNLTTVFTITWGASGRLSNYRFDVQIQRPGGSFVDWKPNTTSVSGTFTADQGTGSYRFQARIRNTTNGFATNYSQPVTITVNP